MVKSKIKRSITLTSNAIKVLQKIKQNTGLSYGTVLEQSLYTVINENPESKKWWLRHGEIKYN
jgi:hypothetical protein